jgi:hypothetical protein
LNSRSRRAALTLLAALASATRAPALDVKLWPLFRYAETGNGDEMRWTALGPLLEFTRTAESRDLYVRPLLHLHQRRGPTPGDRAEILYPLAASRWDPDHESFRFLLFTYRRTREAETPHPPDTAPPPAEWPSRFTLFPFIFYRQSPERGVRLSVFPFYFDLDDFLGYDRVTAVMFPLYLRLEEPRVERRYYVFPFVSTVGGPDGRGFRVWPFYGTTEIVGQKRSTYVLWPFHLRTAQLVPGYGWEYRRVNFPFFAAIDGAGRETRSYGVLAYIHTIDTRHGIESTGAPWPFVVRERRLGDEEYRVWRAFPFYGRSDVGGVSSHFYLWPAYRRKTQDVEDFHYQRDDVGVLVWRRQSLANETSGHREHLLTLLGGLRGEQDDARRFGQTPALFDSLLPKNVGVLTLWAPLYGLFRWDTRLDGQEDWNLLWGLAAREDGRLLGPVHIDLGSPAGDASGMPHGG